MASFFATLRKKAQAIRDELRFERNTATRVGTMQVDTVDALGGVDSRFPVVPSDLSEATMQLINEGHDIQIENFPDEEDITVRGNALSLRDRSYDPLAASGLGRKILRKNVTADGNVLTQEMIENANTVYEIRYDYDLNGETIEIPEGCIVKFEGGSLANGHINWGDNNCELHGNPIFSNIETEGRVISNSYLLKNTMDELQNLSLLEINLLKIGYYRGVELYGYYSVGDTPAPIVYCLSHSNEYEDDGGSVIKTSGIVLEHFFTTNLDLSYFGSIGDGATDNSVSITNLFSYLKNRSKKNNISTELPTVTFQGVHVFNDTLNWDFDGLKLRGCGIRNSVLVYNGDSIAINVGGGDQVRYHSVSDFTIRTYNPLSQVGILFNSLIESEYKNIWVLGAAGVGFSIAGLRMSAESSNTSSWTNRFNNIRVTNTSGIGYLIDGVGINAVFFANCSASKNVVNRWIANGNGVKFTSFQSEGATSGIETRISPYENTLSRVLSLTLDSEYCETKSSDVAGRMILITNRDKNEELGSIYAYGLDLCNPYFWGAGYADYAIELDVQTGLLLGSVRGGFFHGAQKAVVKSERQVERLSLEYVRPLKEFGTGSSIPMLESLSGLSLCRLVTLSADGFLFSPSLSLGSYAPFASLSISSTTKISITNDMTFINASASAGEISINLPSLSSISKTCYVQIRKSDLSENIVKITSDQNELIDGKAVPYELKILDQMVMIANIGSSGWRLISKH